MSSQVIYCIFHFSCVYFNFLALCFGFLNVPLCIPLGNGMTMSGLDASMGVGRWSTGARLIKYVSVVLLGQQEWWGLWGTGKRTWDGSLDVFILKDKLEICMFMACMCWQLIWLLKKPACNSNQIHVGQYLICEPRFCEPLVWAF